MKNLREKNGGTRSRNKPTRIGERVAAAAAPRPLPRKGTQGRGEIRGRGERRPCTPDGAHGSGAQSRERRGSTRASPARSQQPGCGTGEERGSRAHTPRAQPAGSPTFPAAWLRRSRGLRAPADTPGTDARAVAPPPLQPPLRCPSPWRCLPPPSPAAAALPLPCSQPPASSNSAPAAASACSPPELPVAPRRPRLQPGPLALPSPAPSPNQRRGHRPFPRLPPGAAAAATHRAAHCLPANESPRGVVEIRARRPLPAPRPAPRAGWASGVLLSPPPSPFPFLLLQLASRQNCCSFPWRPSGEEEERGWIRGELRCGPSGRAPGRALRPRLLRLCRWQLAWPPPAQARGLSGRQLGSWRGECVRPARSWLFRNQQEA
ncbi:uncharacterized protein LOC144456537 [Phascolarctos cinereus]